MGDHAPAFRLRDCCCSLVVPNNFPLSSLLRLLYFPFRSLFLFPSRVPTILIERFFHERTA